ncbi:MAG: aspartate aminotransferase family protein [Myxococcales bacterium]|nr:aspartate aminotransferase family protein [Myxococcales bacterium]MDD9967996.1 aspartate aminotransferase family protein [Myxococcales bacterium]
MGNREFIERADQTFLRNYRPAPLVLTQGQGCRLEDVEGNRYLDLCAGIAVAAVGHGHPTLARAIAEQAGRLMHVSNLFYNDRAIELAEQVVARTAFDRVFFCNSGAEANEALIKLARRFHFEAGQPERVNLVSMERSFHGRSMGALSLTGQPKYHQGMAPLVGGIGHVPFGDLAALRAAVDERTAAVLLEPVQGEGGVVVPDDAYLRGVRELCDERGALLFFDEVQTGYGRTGKFLAREWSGVIPDACALAKGIAGGFPLGAIAVRETLADGLPPGTHATTYGGNPLACAAGLAVLEILDREGLVARSAERGAYLGGKLAELANKFDSVRDARGLGLLRGLQLAEGVDPISVLVRVREAGVLLSLAGGNVLRFSPPLCVSEEELDEGIAVVDAVLSKGA